MLQVLEWLHPQHSASCDSSGSHETLQQATASSHTAVRKRCADDVFCGGQPNSQSVNTVCGEQSEVLSCFSEMGDDAHGKRQKVSPPPQKKNPQTYLPLVAHKYLLPAIAAPLACCTWNLPKP
jgi:hypothetical protein